MSILILAIFVIGYACIAFEHSIHVDKAASAVITGVLCWTALVFGLEWMPAFAGGGQELPVNQAVWIDKELFHHVGEISGILFFLLGAMTIVEMVDAHNGFSVITDRITTTNRVRLLWILSSVAFVLSPALDNMTTAIVMCALIRRLVGSKEDMWMLAAFVVIAANAGGAWSPIGDVTTIMLWIAGNVSAMEVTRTVFLPAVVCLFLPLSIASFTMRGNITRPENSENFDQKHRHTSRFEERFVFFLGLAILLLVPVFKTYTHLPPFMGIMLGLGIMWFATSLMHLKKEPHVRKELSIDHALKLIDTPSILFFLGILLAVSALQTSGHLVLMSQILDEKIGNMYAINTMIGLLSSIVDNVPLVAGAMGMYSLEQFPMNDKFWTLLAYTAGTGGSVLIIGSAAGVAAMGILKIDFLWYLKRVSMYALLGYFAGVITYYLMQGA